MLCQDEEVTTLLTRVLTESDLPSFAWSGEQRHREYLREWMNRTDSGEIVMVGLFDGDESVGFAYLDFAIVPEVGTLYALNVKEDRRSEGLGSVLIKACENIVRSRNLFAVELRVETKNHRARKLYEKLGYVDHGTSIESWEQYDEEGNIQIYTTDAVIMRKELS